MQITAITTLTEPQLEYRVKVWLKEVLQEMNLQAPQQTPTPQPTTPPEFVGIKGFADLAHVSVHAVYKWIADGVITFQIKPKGSKKVLFKYTDVINFIKNREV